MVFSCLRRDSPRSPASDYDDDDDDDDLTFLSDKKQ